MKLLCLLVFRCSDCQWLAALALTHHTHRHGRTLTCFAFLPKDAQGNKRLLTVYSSIKNCREMTHKNNNHQFGIPHLNFTLVSFIKKIIKKQFLQLHNSALHGTFYLCNIMYICIYVLQYCKIPKIKPRARLFKTPIKLTSD